MTQWFNWRHFFGRQIQIEASPWLPPALDDAAGEEESRSLSPLAAPVHVRSGSAVVRVENGVLVVEREDEPRFERPIELVSASTFTSLRRLRIQAGYKPDERCRLVSSTFMQATS
jgi:hypothetical protein